MKSSSSLSSVSSLFRYIIQKRWLGKAFLILLAVAAVVKLVTAFVEGPNIFFEQLVNGLRLGFVYALIALGYTMVYGIVRLINFAHGDVFMFGSFISYYAITRLQMHAWVEKIAPDVLPPLLSLGIGTVTVVVFSMFLCALLAITIERIAYKPLREAPRISALITAIGVSFFLEYFGALNFVFTPNFITYERPFDVQNFSISSQGIAPVVTGVPVPDGALLISNIFIIIVITSVALLALLQFIVKSTKIGKAMRAVAYDKQTARLMGINADLVISTTFAIGAGLAGAGGMLYAIAFPQIFFSMGVIPGLKAFVAAVLGGIGSIPGAVIGSLILGEVEVLSAAYISTPMRDAIAFTILILVLLVRPTGIFGEPTREKA